MDDIIAYRIDYLPLKNADDVDKFFNIVAERNAEDGHCLCSWRDGDNRRADFAALETADRRWKPDDMRQAAAKAVSQGRELRAIVRNRIATPTFQSQEIGFSKDLHVIVSDVSAGGENVWDSLEYHEQMDALRASQQELALTHDPAYGGAV